MRRDPLLRGRRVERQVQERLAEEHALAWSRIAPGGTPLWLLPDEDLEGILNELAPTSKARTVEITYLLDELNRRGQAKLKASMERATRHMVWLTWAAIILAAISAYAALS